MTWGQRQLMDICVADRQFHHFFYHTAGYCWIELRIHIGLSVDERLVEVNHLRLSVIQTNRILMTTHIEEVECRRVPSRPDAYVLLH